jgi:hypothetical protein
LEKVAVIVERLAERTDALAHSVELLTSMQIESEKRMTEVQRGMAQVASILLSHENRLDRLEGNRAQ